VPGGRCARRAEGAKHGRNYLQVLVNISAIACGCARNAGHDVVAALTVPLKHLQRPRTLISESGR
jgi:hypothetical protein